MRTQAKTSSRTTARLYLADESFDAATDADDEAWMPADYLEDDRLEPAAIVTAHDFVDTATSELRAALKTLDARSRDILESRWLADESDKATLQELGDRYGISAERVRQLEVTAIDRLREVVMPRLGFDREHVA